MPRVARLIAIPRRYQAEGVQRYGFHGLSYAYLMEELARLGDPAARQRPRDPRAPRQRRQHGRDARRPQHRHQHGLHAGLRLADGHALAATSIRGCSATCAAPRQMTRRAVRPHGQRRIGPARRFGDQLRRARPAGARRRRPARGRGARRCSATRRRSGSAPTRPRSAGSTRWSSPAASARTRRASASGSARGSAFSASRSTPRRNAQDAPLISPAAARVARARHPHRRGTDDREIGHSSAPPRRRSRRPCRSTVTRRPAPLSTMTTTTPLTPQLLKRIDAYWRAANYLSVGQIYLYDNPLLKRPLALGDVKRMLLGHWGTTPGQNFIYAHLNRVIRQYDLDMIYISGPGHGGPAVVANTYLEGTYSEVYPDISQDEAGLRRLFRQFSFPGGIPSHASPECPGSIHEGGELGYSLSHAFGAVFDNPDLIVACVVGDGEAETGPLATAWHSNKFLDPVTDGAVLPILHLNGYKIANPTVLARIPREELEQLLRGYGWTPLLRRGPRARRRCTRRWRRRSTRSCRRSGASSTRRAAQGARSAAALADDRARFAEGLDRAEGGRRPADRGHVPLAPGAALGSGHAPRAPGAARGLAAQLPARGAVRRRGPAAARARRARAHGAAPHGREPARQRRPAAARPADARLPRLRASRCPSPGCSGIGDTRVLGPVPARRRQAERGAAQLPHLRSRRDDLQRPGGRVRGRPSGNGKPRRSRTTSSSRRPGG